MGELGLMSLRALRYLRVNSAKQSQSNNVSHNNLVPRVNPDKFVPQIPLLGWPGGMDIRADFEAGGQVGHIHGVDPSYAWPVESLIEIQQPTFMGSPHRGKLRPLPR